MNGLFRRKQAGGQSRQAGDGNSLARNEPIEIENGNGLKRKKREEKTR